MKNKILLVFMAMTMVFAMAVSVQAVPVVIDFEISALQPALAQVTFGGNNLVGFDISIDKITGINTPLHQGNLAALTSSDGMWNFTAPQLTSTPPDHWLFQSFVPGVNTTLNISGNFTNAGTGGNVTNPVPLNTNTWISAEVHKIIGSDTAYAVTGVFTDIKSIDLGNYFGFDAANTDFFATFTFGINLPVGTVPPNIFASTSVQSGNITQSAAPIPGSLMLLGTGLLGLVGIGIRRKSA